MNQNYKLMKKIVKGNDFTLRIPVMKMVEGQPQAFPLPACTDIVVQVCNQFKRIPLAFEVDVKEDNALLARVEGDKMSRGGGIPGCIFDLLADGKYIDRSACFTCDGWQGDISV